MAESQRLGLADIDALHIVRLDAANHLEQPCLAGLLQRDFELEGHVEMVFDRALVAACDEDHLANAGGISLFHRVLDQRLVDDWQHFLGLGLRRRQEPGA